MLVITSPRPREIAAMRMPVNLMAAIGKAALKLLGPGAWVEAALDGLEIAKEAWNYLEESWKQSPQEQRQEAEALAAAADAEIERVAAELAPGEAGPVRMRLATFLKQVPSRIRQSQRRPADPTGRTVRPGLVLNRPEDLVPFIPDQLPRSQAGDRPLPGVDWVLEDLLGLGGFGEVWKARHAEFPSFEPVALKFCTDPLARERLLRHEAKVLDRVMRQGRHPGIVRLEATQEDVRSYAIRASDHLRASGGDRQLDRHKAEPDPGRRVPDGLDRGGQHGRDL
jgi:hypothetical protein